MLDAAKRWLMILMAISIALMALLIMGMRVSAVAMQSQVNQLKQQNQSLLDSAIANAKEIKQLLKDDDANDQIAAHRQQGKASAREQTRSNTYVIRQSLSSESCARMSMPAGAISMLKRSNHADGSPLSDSSKVVNP